MLHASSSPLTPPSLYAYAILLCRHAGTNGTTPTEYCSFLTALLSAITDLRGDLLPVDEVAFLDATAASSDINEFRTYREMFRSPPQARVYTATTNAFVARKGSVDAVRAEAAAQVAAEARKAAKWAARLESFKTDPMAAATAAARAAAIAQLSSSSSSSEPKPGSARMASRPGSRGSGHGGGSQTDRQHSIPGLSGRFPVSHMHVPQPRPDVHSWFSRAQQWFDLADPSASMASILRGDGATSRDSARSPVARSPVARSPGGMRFTPQPPGSPRTPPPNSILPRMAGSTPYTDSARASTAPAGMLMGQHESFMGQGEQGLEPPTRWRMSGGPHP